MITWFLARKSEQLAKNRLKVYA